MTALCARAGCASPVRTRRYRYCSRSCATDDRGPAYKAMSRRAVMKGKQTQRAQFVQRLLASFGTALAPALACLPPMEGAQRRRVEQALYEALATVYKQTKDRERRRCYGAYVGRSA